MSLFTVKFCGYSQQKRHKLIYGGYSQTLITIIPPLNIPPIDTEIKTQSSTRVSPSWQKSSNREKVSAPWKQSFGCYQFYHNYRIFNYYINLLNLTLSTKSLQTIPPSYHLESEQMHPKSKTKYLKKASLHDVCS
jgi:hypothetical protein